MMTAVSNSISLQGSAEILVDYFFYAINSILYQRGIYPEASFKRNTKYELSVLIAVDEALTTYLNKILTQLKEWLLINVVKKLVLVVKCVKTGEVMERWNFDILTEKAEEPGKKSKTLSAIQEEIRNVIRQIVASNTILPVLNASCSFELLVYTDRNADIPDGWDESGPQFVKNSAEIKLRSFSTTIHKVDHLVSYKITS